MKQLSTFFGQIIRKIDLDFINLGNRQAINETNIDLSNGLGGVVAGLDVYPSSDNLSLFISAGEFYSGGLFNPANGSGGGEKGVVYSPQTFTALTPTLISGGNQTYLLIYVKTTVQNTDPSPNSPNVVYSAKNIQTGQNQPVRQYTAGVIVISNPITKSEVGNFDGVPLALVQTDSNGSIVSVDTTVKRNYLLGGALDIVKSKIIDSAVPNALITTRMIGDGQVTASKFATNSITSPYLAPWDGSSGNYAFSGTVPGSGVGTDHLKDGAVTDSKLNYSGSVANFSPRNRLTNSSFESYSSNGGVSIINNWNIMSGTSGIWSSTVVPSTDFSEYGYWSAKLVGGAASVIPGSVPTAINVGISQTVDFNDNLNGKPITAFVYVKATPALNFAVSGTTGVAAQLDFIANSTNSIVQTVVFNSFSGTDTGWHKLTSSSPIVPNVDCRLVTLSVYGAFNTTVYVDGAFLGQTDLVPAWDGAIQDQLNLGELDASSIATGQFGSARLSPASVLTTQVANADGSVNTNSGPGIMGSQIQQATITGGNIAAGTITASNLAAGVLAVPQGAIIMWDDSVSIGCPTGWTDITMTKMGGGKFPLGYNSNAGSNISVAQMRQKTSVSVTGEASGDGLGVNTLTQALQLPTRGGQDGSGENSIVLTSNPALSVSPEEVVPYYVLRFCQKN